MEFGTHGWGQKLLLKRNDVEIKFRTTPATSNYGTHSVGDGAWDGLSSGFFVGSTLGTIYAANAISGFAGNLVDLQVAGSSKLSVDSTGTLTITGTLTLPAQTGNVVFSSPSGGGSGVPGFRTLVAADIPNLDASKITAGTLALARGGTNTDNSSVAINQVWASPSSGGSGSALYRALVSADIPNLDVAKITTGTFATSFIPSLDTSKITTGTFAAARLTNAKNQINFFINTFAIRGGSLGVSPAGDGVLLGSIPTTAVGSCFKALTGGTAFTDLTTAANNATTADVTITYAATNDALYISHATLKYTAVKIKYSTAAVYSATLVWEYWNGTAWSTLLTTTPTFLVDATAGTFPATNPLKATAGTLFLTFNPPSDWASTTVNAVAGFYIRLRCSAFTSNNTGFAGDQIWLYTVTSGVGISAGQPGNITRIDFNATTTISGATSDSKFLIINGTTGVIYLFTATKATQHIADTSINLAVAETDQILVQQIQQNAAAIAPSSEFAGVNFTLTITPA